MFEVKLHDLNYVDEKQLTRVVCVSKYKDKWVFSKNKKRGGWEIPGGHIEPGETWQQAARREMFEETGATKIKLKPICLYSISSFAILCYAEIEELSTLPNFEISEIGFFNTLPKDLSFPDSHKLFFETVEAKLKIKKLSEKNKKQ